MAETTIKKINSKIKFLYRIRSFLGRQERKMLVSALIQSNFDYASNSWYRGLLKKYKNKLQVCQNKVIRYILDYKYRHHLYVSDFKNVGFLNVANRVNYFTLSLMFSIYHGTAPSYFDDFNLLSHSHRTRHNNMAFSIPNVNSQGKISFKYSGIVLWNSLPQNIKCIKEKYVFKKECKEYLLDKMFEEESNEFTQ